MTILVPIALFGWIPVVLALFAWLPARRALIVGVLLAWLFLPVAGFKLAGIPAYDKTSATSLGLMLAITLFDFRRLRSFRPSWADVPMLIWCVCPCVSSLSNGLGIYDGLSDSFSQSVTWGLPYLMGRLYFGDLAGLREFACGLFIGGLIYIPLCLFEIRMSPQLSKIVYGFLPGRFTQVMRFGGYRPVVFMQHGLMVSLWMAAASLTGYWLWARRALRQLWGIPLVILFALLLITTVLCKSVGALVLLAAGLVASWLAWRLRSRTAMVCLLAIAPLYMISRLTGSLQSMQMVEVVSSTVNEERARSLFDRMEQEDVFIERSRQRPFFGWAAWNFMPRDETGEKTIRGVDSLWMIALGAYGYVGLLTVIMTLLLPSCLFVWRYAPQLWRTPQAAPAAALAVVLSLYVADCMFNGMVNPVFGIGGGGLVSLCVRQQQADRRASGAVRVAPSGALAHRKAQEDLRTD